jgi:nucleotide-binding universal stress UspA family protein
MFQHILVPVDGSGTSEVAVGKATELGPGVWQHRHRHLCH